MIDRFTLKLPLVGAIAVKHHTVQFTRTLGTILAGGTPWSMPYRVHGQLSQIITYPLSWVALL